LPVPGRAESAPRTAHADLVLRRSGDLLRDLQLAHLGHLQLPAAQRAAVRSSRPRARVSLRTAGRPDTAGDEVRSSRRVRGARRRLSLGAARAHDAAYLYGTARPPGG